MSNEATPAVKDDQPSEAMAELKDLVTTQSQSTEVQIISDILAQEYEVLQVVPATSNPIARLAVRIDLSGPQADGARLVRTTLSVSYEMSSRSGEGQGSYEDLDVESERYDNFRRPCALRWLLRLRHLRKTRAPWPTSLVVFKPHHLVHPCQDRVKLQATRCHRQGRVITFRHATFSNDLNERVARRGPDATQRRL